MFFGKRSGTTNPAANARGGSRPQFSFILPIPPVSRSIYQFMRRKVGLGDAANNADAHALNSHQSEEAKRKRKIQKQTEPFQIKLRDLQAQKQDGLAQINRAGHEQMEIAYEETKEKYTHEYVAKYQERHAKLQQELEETKEAFGRQQEEEGREVEEPQPKRARLEPSEDSDQELKRPHVENDHSKDDTSKVDPNGNADADTGAPSEAAAATGTLNPSEEKAEALKTVSKHLHDLGETKKEMIWLLKQVIKAEQKQKDDS